MSQTFTMPDGRVVLVPPFIMSPEQAAERDRLLSSRYFLVEQGSLGEILRCGDCKGKHKYFTFRCIERPFSGIAEGLWAYLQTAGTPQAMARLTLAERTRINHLMRLFGEATPASDFASSHPETARSMAVGERDILKGTVPMGVLEEIPMTFAQRLQDRINLRLPLDARLQLPGLTA